MKTKMTVVVDNISYDGIAGEWGLSVLTEYGDIKILTDVGASNLFVDNMQKLGLNIADVDYATLSHAHYDHANGMPAFFAHNDKAKFYVRDAVRENCYAKKFIFRKYIGIPKGVLSDYPDRIEYVSGDYKLCEGVYLIGHKTPGLSKCGERELMYRRVDRKWIADDFAHEQSIVFDTECGLVVINSCSHGGAVNIIREIADTFPNRHVYALIGGFHLFNKSEEEIRTVSHEINETGIDYVCTGHCTKSRAYELMKEELGDKLHQLHVGLQMEF